MSKPVLAAGTLLLFEEGRLTKTNHQSSGAMRRTAGACASNGLCNEVFLSGHF
jgi:hypothetical protein